MPDSAQFFEPLATPTQAGPTPADGWQPVVPVPADAPLAVPHHRQGAPSQVWDYRDASGSRLFRIARFDRPDGKEVLPLAYARRADGRCEWRWQAAPPPRALYGLDQLAARPDAPVLVAEGEKTADAAAQLFPDHVAMTSAGGAGAAGKADWSPLRGRRITIWPDNDAAGHGYAKAVAGLAAAAGAEAVAVVAVPPELPSAWDLADPPPPGWNAERVRALLVAARPVAASADDADAGWLALVPLDGPDLPRLDMRWLPDGWLRDFVQGLAVATETPVELPAALALATVSAAAARRFRVAVKPGYSEPLNLWLACALPPGNRKSSVQTACAEPLIAWERSEAERLRPSIAAAESEWRTCEARAKELRQRAAKADNEADRRALAAEAAATEASAPEVPRVPQLWTSDATPERLGSLLAENRERMAWLSSEGGIFDILAGRYSSGVPNLDLILKGHSGDAERVDRGSRPPVFLRQPLLTIGLAPQPDVLAGLAHKPVFRGRGLLGRFLWLLPPSPLGTRTLDAPSMPPGVPEAFEIGVRAILDTPPATSGDGSEQAHMLHLAPDAYAEWLVFARLVDRAMLPGGRFEAATDFAGKLPGTAARIAGVLHVARDSDSLEVSVETMGNALAMTRALAQHSLAALDDMGADDGIAGARRVWRWIKGGSRTQFRLREAFEALKGSFPRVAALQPAVETLVERGYLVAIEEEPRAGAGRPPSRLYRVRPSIAARWA